MAGVIEQARVKHRQIVERTLAEKSERAIEQAERDALALAAHRAQARKGAMAAAKVLTGRVIFPARWDLSAPHEKSQARRDVIDARVVIEGRVEIVVEVDKHGNVFGVQVSRPGDDDVRKTAPYFIEDAQRGWMPDPSWFRDSLAGLGVI